MDDGFIRPGDLLFIQEPTTDLVAAWIRHATQSDFSHVIVALGNDEFAECHVGDHVISAFKRNRLEHRIAHKYRKVEVHRVTALEDQPSDVLRDHLLGEVTAYQGNTKLPAGREKAVDPLPLAPATTHEGVATQVTFGLGDGVARSIIQYKARLWFDNGRPHTSTGLRFVRALALATRRLGQERLFCSSFAFTMINWAGGKDAINVEAVRERINHLFADATAPPGKPAGTYPRADVEYDEADDDSFGGKTLSRLASLIGFFAFGRRVVKYFFNQTPYEPKGGAKPTAEAARDMRPAYLSPRYFVTPADMLNSGSLQHVASRWRGEPDWTSTTSQRDGNTRALAVEPEPPGNRRLPLALSAAMAAVAGAIVASAAAGNLKRLHAPTTKGSDVWSLWTATGIDKAFTTWRAAGAGLHPFTPASPTVMIWLHVVGLATFIVGSMLAVARDAIATGPACAVDDGTPAVAMRRSVRRRSRSRLRGDLGPRANRLAFDHGICRVDGRSSLRTGRVAGSRRSSQNPARESVEGVASGPRSSPRAARLRLGTVGHRDGRQDRRAGRGPGQQVVIR